MTGNAISALAVLCCVFASCGDGLISGETPNEVPFVDGQPLPEAKPREGWILVCKPATYKTVSETVQISPASSYLESIPAKYAAKEETIQVQPMSKVAKAIPAAYKTESFQVLIEPESTQIEVIPARYETVDEVVVVEEARQEIRTIPARFRCQSKQIQVSPGYTYWKRISKGDEFNCGDSFAKCEVAAKFLTVNEQVLESEATTTSVDIPAITKVVQTRKLVKDADVRKTTVPAKFVTMSRQVLDTQATASFDTVPAKFETITTQVLVEPESTRRIEIPAKFKTVSRQELDQPESKVWRRIACDPCDIVTKYKSIPGSSPDSWFPVK